MSLHDRTSVSPRTARVCPIVGICIFVAAFFLPACKDIRGTGGPISIGTLAGWQCAKLSLYLIASSDTYRSPLFLALLSGFINPLVLLILTFRFSNKFPPTRRVLTFAILGCMVATWIFFAMSHLLPLIGHVMWIAGVFLILVGELPRRPA